MFGELFFIILIANLIIGVLLGLSSIGGFLLPLFYVGFLALPLTESLALSFFSFAIGGIVGTYTYWKTGHIQFKLAIILSVASIPGAFLGVKLNIMIPEDIAKIILYLFVFISGLALLHRNKNDGHEGIPKLFENKPFVLLLGLVISAICALTGAGGPIILVPLMTALGLNIRVAVGVCLFNSIFIALPSILGYFQHSDMDGMGSLLLASLIGQVFGIVAGTYLSNRVQLHALRLFIALFTLLTASYMILDTMEVI